MIRGKTLMEVWSELLKIMICSGYLDVQHIITSKKINWIFDKRRMCFWVSREVRKAISCEIPKTKEIMLRRYVTLVRFL